eukprot:15432609-Alexandrium_andersonii.AAC.1
MNGQNHDYQERQGHGYTGADAEAEGEEAKERCPEVVGNERGEDGMGKHSMRPSENAVKNEESVQKKEAKGDAGAATDEGKCVCADDCA